MIRRSNLLFGAPFRTANIDCVQYDSCNGVMSASQQLRRTHVKQAVFTPAEYTYVFLLTGLFVVTVMVWYCGQSVGHSIEQFIQTYAVRIAVRILDWPLSQSLRRTCIV